MARTVPRQACLAWVGVLSMVGVGCATLPPASRTPSPDARVLEHVPAREFENDRCGPGSLSVVLGALGDPVSEDELAGSIPRASGSGVLSVDLLLAARQRGYVADLVTGNPEAVRAEIEAGRPAILMLRLLNAPGRGHDIFHYVVVDGMDPRRRLFRFQFGDGKARWATLDELDGAWRGAGRALLRIRAPAVLDELRAAVALERTGRTDEAAERYREILEDHPDLVRAWVNLGNTEAARNRPAVAERAYRRALELAPGDVDTLNNLAWLLLKGGERLDEAESLARAALAREGGDRALVLDTLARVQAAQGRCDEADATFGEIVILPELPPDQRAAAERARDETRAGCRVGP